MSDNLKTQQQNALEQLLDMAPPPPPSPQLAKQILAGTSARSQNSNVVEFASNREPSPPRQNNTSNWLIGGLMAASLTLGIWSGTSDFADLLVTAPLELAGITSPQDTDFYNLLDGFNATESLL